MHTRTQKETKICSLILFIWILISILIWMLMFYFILACFEFNFIMLLEHVITHTYICNKQTPTYMSYITSLSLCLVLFNIFCCCFPWKCNNKKENGWYNKFSKINCSTILLVCKMIIAALNIFKTNKQTTTTIIIIIIWLHIQ